MRLNGPAMLAFTFDGETVPARPGDTVASAMAAAGRMALRRTGRDDASNDARRGLWCGMGACFDCAVTIDGRIGERACLAKVAGGEVVRSAMPAGTTLDPLAPLAPPPEGASLPERHCDILVIGAGPAGLAAAFAARRLGASVLVLDERAASGGQYYKQPATPGAVPVDRQGRDGAALIRSAVEAGVEIVQNAQVWGAFAADDVLALVAGRAVRFRPQRLILATGAYERPAPIPGWTLPGVMTTGAAQTLERAHGVAPGRRVVVGGNGPLNFQLASALTRMGVAVAALAEAAPRPGAGALAPLLQALRLAPDLMAEGLRYRWQLWRRGVPLHWSTAAVAARGDGRVEEVDLAPLDASGRGRPEATLTIACDTLCLGHGFIASTEIARALGCAMRLDDRHLGTTSVVTDETGLSSIAGVYAVGDGAVVAGARVALERGRLAGDAAARSLGLGAALADDLAPARRRLARATGFQQALWTLFSAPPVRLDLVPDATILCRCEGLDFGRVRAEIAAGWDTAATLKRRLRLGMGSCQGRNCTATAARLLAEATGRARHVEEGFAPRLPVKPFPAAALALEKPEWGGHRRAGSPDLARGAEATAAEAPGRADVVVIGGGVVGSCLAFYLADAGADVLVVERDDVNLQASGANAGSLHVQLLSFDFGAKAEAGGGPAAATLPLGPWSIGLWQELAAIAGGDFEIRVTGGLMVADTPRGMAFLEAKVALERQHGIDSRMIDRDGLRRLAPTLSDHLLGAEHCPGEGKINPLTATYRVMEAAMAQGARLLRRADVKGLERRPGGWAVRTSRGAIEAGIVINAAGPWARLVGAMAGVETPVWSAPLQMIVTERAPKLVEPLVAHADRHLSLKQLASGGIVIGGAWTAAYDQGRNMNVTLRQSIEGNLWVAGSVLPQLAGLRVLRSWAGMNVNIDGAPIVGEAPGAPGFFTCVTSNGYTLAPAVARITADLVLTGRTARDIRPYTLARFTEKVA
ncbi:MAG: FAD-dependent oxidoreductase [Geminicoccaceae bacterium]